jgi:hypothetical protein
MILLEYRIQWVHHKQDKLASLRSLLLVRQYM